MLLSQLFLSTIIIFIIYKTILTYKRGNFSKNFTFIWLLLWISVLFLIFQQNILIKTAHFFGISRGVDLVIYLSIILNFYLIYKIFANLNDLNQKITKIIREEALSHPLQHSNKPGKKHLKQGNRSYGSP